MSLQGNLECPLCSVEMVGGTRTSDRKTRTRRQVPETGRFCFQGHGGMDRVAVDNASRMSMILRTEILLYWSTKEWRYPCVFPELEKW